MFNLKITAIIFSTVLIFALLIGQIGCTEHPTASDIMKNSLSAMEKVNTYQLNTDVTWTYITIGGTAPGKSSITWIGDRTVNTADKVLHKFIYLVSTDMVGDKINWTIENYIVSGYAYVKANSDTGQSNTFNVWYRSQSSNTGWTGENQISELIGLMNTSTSSTLAGSEKLDNIDCYILNIQPSMAAIADWVGTQFQGYGGIDYSTGPFLGGRDDYLKFFKSGSFRLWIAKDDYLVMKAEITPHFEATAQDLGVTTQTVQDTGFSQVNSDFQGEMNFSKYNQPVSIQPPPDSEVVSQ